jgi:AcrR family transcriptional regulator
VRPEDIDSGLIIDYSRYVATQAERREGTRGKILEAARKLFRRKGFDETSVDEIVLRANVAKGTFYQYFQTKMDVAEAISLAGRERLAAGALRKLETGASPLEVCRETVATTAEWIEKNRALVRPLFLRALEQAPPPSSGSTRMLLATMLREAQKRGEVRNDVPAEVMAALLSGSIFQMGLYWALHGKRGQLREWIVQAWKIHMEGVLPR